MTQPVNFVQQDPKVRESKFRSWVRNLWVDNCEERLTYGQDPATINQYWDTYKFWLKREYKYQRGRNNVKSFD
jgi:hypothetical protein